MLAPISQHETSLDECQVSFDIVNLVVGIGLTCVGSGLDIKLSECERSKRDRLILILRKVINISF